MNVTATFLPTLRVTPALGRNFPAEEDRPGGNTRVVADERRLLAARVRLRPERDRPIDHA